MMLWLTPGGWLGIHLMENGLGLFQAEEQPVWTQENTKHKHVSFEELEEWQIMSFA